MHRHAHDHSHAHGSTTSNGLLIAFLLNLTFAMLEIGGGLWTQSAAILADAVHDLGDSLALACAWMLERVSRKESDTRYTFGYRRFSLLGAIITALVLIVGGVLVLGHAIPRLFSPVVPHAPGMIAFAVLGIVVNGTALLQLRRGEGANNRAVVWHLLEDVLGWVAVLITATILLFFEWPLLDPLLSIGITLFVLRHVVIQLRSALRIFLQRSPETFSLETLTARLQAVPGVVALHHVHLWSLDGDRHIFSAHVDIADPARADETERIRNDLHELLAENNLHHATLELEPASSTCHLRDDTHGGNNEKD